MIDLPVPFAKHVSNSEKTSKAPVVPVFRIMASSRPDQVVALLNSDIFRPSQLVSNSFGSGWKKEYVASNPAAPGIPTGRESLLVCEQEGGHCILQLDLESNPANMNALAGKRKEPADAGSNPAHVNKLNLPRSIAIASKNQLYICDRGNHVIKRYNIEKNEYTIVAGTGKQNKEQLNELKFVKQVQADKVPLDNPHHISINDELTHIAICDYGKYRILILNLQSNTIERSIQPLTAPPLTCEFFENPKSLFISTRFGIELVPDSTVINDTIDPSSSDQIQLICGSRKEHGFKDGSQFEARFDGVSSMLLNDSETKLYIADYNNHRIRLYDFETKKVSTFAGTESSKGVVGGSFLESSFNHPGGLAWLNGGNDIAVSNSGVYNYKNMNTANGKISILKNVGEIPNDLMDAPLAPLWDLFKNSFKIDVQQRFVSRGVTSLKASEGEFWKMNDVQLAGGSDKEGKLIFIARAAISFYRDVFLKEDEFSKKLVRPFVPLSGLWLHEKIAEYFEIKSPNVPSDNALDEKFLKLPFNPDNNSLEAARIGIEFFDKEVVQKILDFRLSKKQARSIQKS